MKFQLLPTIKPVCTIALVLAFFAAAAQPGTAQTAPGGIKSVAAFVDPTDIKIKVKGGSQEVISIPEARYNVVRQILLGPSGLINWHSHPAPVIVLVQTGSLILTDGETCTDRTYTAGQSFVDHGRGHLHKATAGADGVELWAIYLDVATANPTALDLGTPAASPCPGM